MMYISHNTILHEHAVKFVCILFKYHSEDEIKDAFSSYPPKLSKTSDGLIVIQGYLVYLSMCNDVFGGSMQ